MVVVPAGTTHMITAQPFARMICIPTITASIKPNNTIWTYSAKAFADVTIGGKTYTISVEVDDHGMTSATDSGAWALPENTSATIKYNRYVPSNNIGSVPVSLCVMVLKS